MRVLTSSPRKTGGSHLRCLIASSYGLDVLTARDAPDKADAAQVVAWLSEFPERSVASVGYPWTPLLAEVANQRGIALVGVLRHPFDLFVSNYDVAQQRAARNKNKPEDALPSSHLAGLSLDDPAMLAYARTGFSAELDWLRGWHDSGAGLVRFEQLDANPAEAVETLAHQLGALDSATIAHAVDLCPSESVIVSRPVRGRRMGSVSAGSWRERLPEALTAVLREQYSPDIELLGYEVL